MLNSPVLDVAISLIFIYLLVALMVTGVTQFIFSLKETKSKLLNDAINHLFFDDAWKAISEKLISSPQIQMLKRRTDKFPSFIPPNVFANAILDTITVGKPTIEEINAFLTKEHGEFGNWLKVVVAQCENSVPNLKHQLADLFDNAMDSVTNWYSRESKWWSRGIALVICATMNIDSKDTISKTSNKPVTPTNKPQSADNAPLYNSALINIKEQSVPIGWKKYFERLAIEKSTLASQKSGSQTNWFTDFLNSCKIVFFKILDLCLSAAAVSLGAPFWFDLLQKLTPLRKKQMLASKTSGQTAQS